MAEKEDVRRKLYDKLNRLYGEDMDFGAFDEFKEGFNDEASVRQAYQILRDAGVETKGFLGSEDNFVKMLKNHLDSQKLDDYSANGQFMPRSTDTSRDYLASLLDKQNPRSTAAMPAPKAKKKPQATAPAPADSASVIPAEAVSKPDTLSTAQPAAQQPAEEQAAPQQGANSWEGKTGYNPATYNPGQLYTPNPETQQIMGQLGKFGQAPEQPNLEQPDLRSQLFGKKRTELDLSLGEKGDIAELDDTGEKFTARSEQVVAGRGVTSEVDRVTYNLKKAREDYERINEENSTPTSDADERYRRSLRKQENIKRRKYISAAEDLMDDSRKLIEAVEKGKNGTMMGNLLRGFKDGVFDLDQWTMGITDMLKSMNVKSVLEKADRDEELTEDEENLLDAVVVNMATTASLSKDLPRAYKAGLTTGESIPFMVEMATGTGGFISGVSAATKGLLKYSAKWLAKRGAKSLATKAAKEVMKGGIGFVRGLGASALNTVFLDPARVGYDYTQRGIGDVQFNMDNYGRFVYAGRENAEEGLTTLGKAFVSTMAETQSEMMGEQFAPILNFAGKGLARLSGLSGTKLYKGLSHTLTNSETLKKMKDFFQRTQWHGVIGEYAEEVYNNLISYGMGDMTKEELLDLDQNIDTFLGVSVMSAFFGAAGAAGYARDRHKWRKGIRDFEGRWGKQDLVNLQSVRESVKGMTIGQTREYIKSIYLNEDLNNDEKKDLAQYVEYLFKEGGHSDATFAKAEEEGNPGEAEVTESLQTAFDEGADAESHEEKAAVRQRMEDARKALMQDENNPNDQQFASLVEQYKDNPTKAYTELLRQGYDEMHIQRALDYYNAISSHNGLIDSIEESVENDVKRQIEEVDANTHENGTMIKATDRKTQSNGYIIHGNVVTKPDGTVDLQRTDNLIIMRGEDGQQFFVRPQDLLVGETLDPEQVKQQLDTTYREKMLQREAELVDYAEEVVNHVPQAGEVLQVGAQTFQVMGMEEDGSVTLMQQTGNGEEVSPISIPRDQYLQALSKQMNIQQPAAPAAPAATTGTTTPTPPAAPAEPEAPTPPTAPTAPAAPAAQTEPTAEEAMQATTQEPETPAAEGKDIPLDEFGNPKYEETDADTAYDAILKEAESDAVAASVIDGTIEELEADLKAKQKEKVKVTQKGNVKERIAAEKKKQQEIAAIQKKLDAWKAIQGVPAARKRAEEEAALAQQQAEHQAAVEAARKKAEEEAKQPPVDTENAPEWTVDKPEDARKRGFRMVGSEKVERQQPVEGLQGKETAARFAEGKKPNGAYFVMGAGQLQPSHIQGQRNPLHFIPEAQPKDRKDNASVLASQKIAQEMNPEEITSVQTAYTGAPTVNARGEVIQGNNRSDALKFMYQKGGEQAAAYKQYLMDHAGEFGLKREDIEKMENPVLVNRVDVSDEEAIELGQYNAADTESGGTERIKSQQTIQKLGSRVSSFINILMKGGEDMTLSELLAQNGVQALKWLAQNGIITNTQIESAVQPSGALTEDAVADLKNVLFDTVFQGAPSGLKGFFNAMPSKTQRAILGTAYRDNVSPEGSRIREHLQSAMMAFTTLMSDKDFAAAKTLQEARAAVKMWANQYVIDETTGKSLLNSDKFNNFALELAARFKTCSQKAQQELLNQLFNLVQGKQESMFDEARGPVALADAIKEVFGIDFKVKENGQNGSLSVAGNNQGGTQRQPGEPAGTEPGEQRPQGEGTPVSGGGIDVDGTEPGESDLAEDTALAARFTETDEEEEENLPSGTVYRKTYLLDGKHKVTKVDEPDSKGHYHGSVYKAFGKTFSDLKEVADYADLKSVEEDFGFDNDIQSKFIPIEGSETDEEVDGVQTHTQKFKYRGFIVAKVDEKDADGTTQSRYTFSGYNYPSLQEVAEAVDRRIPTFIFSEEEERSEKDQEVALDISPIGNAVVAKTDDGTEERSSWVFNNSYARLEKVVEKDKDGNITGTHYEGWGRRFDSLSDAYKFKSEEYELIGEHWSSATRMEDDGKGRTGRTITIDNNHEVKYSFVEDGLTRNDVRYEFNGKTYLNMHDLMDAIEEFDKQEKNSKKNSAVDKRFKQVGGEVDGYDSIRKEYTIDGKYSVTEITKKESDGTLGETVYQAYNKEFKSREEVVKFLDKEDTLLFAHLTDEKKEQEPQLMLLDTERSHAKAYLKYDVTIDTETTGDGVIVSRRFEVFGIEFGSFTDFCDAVSKMSSNLKRWRDEVEASGTEGVYYETKYGKEEMVVTEVPGDMWTGPQYQVRSGANTRIVEEEKIGLLIASGEWIPLRLSSDEKQEREQKKARLKEIEKLKGKTFTDGENTYLIEGINNGMVNVMFNDQVKTVYDEAQVYNDIQSGKWKDVNETEDKAPQPEQPTEDQPTDEPNKPGKKGTKKTPKAEEKPSEENPQKETPKKPEETREEVELTEEDIRKANVPEEMKTAAIAYVKGNRNVFAQLAYQTVKDYVRNQSRDSAADSSETDTAQLGEGTDGTAGGTSRQGRGQGVQVDNADNGETAPGSRPGRESSQTDVAPSDGVEGDRGLSPVAPSVPVDHTGDGNTRAGRVGSKKRADGTQRGGRKGGTRLPGKDAGRGTETQRGGNHSVDEEISQVEQDILDALKDSFLPKRDRLYDVTTLMAGLGVNAFKILGLTLKLGGLYIKKGFYDYKKWKQNMHKSLDKALAENTTFTPEDIEEYISECWNAAYEMDGETHLISEWADKLGREELKKKMKLSIEEKRKLQMEAEKVETIIGDIDNIREALPFLLPKQQEDVQKAEVQFFDESHKDDAHGNGKGYLFTNGTGTGKTYTGLGIVKRFLKQGKKRILIVTAQDSKIKDFIRDAKNLGIEASMLQDTKDKGQGVVVTQYANMYQNMALLEDTFDLIIYDESHKLQENKSGHSTARARQHHMLANRDPQQAILRKLQNTELFRRGREMEDKCDYMEDVLQEYRNSTYDQLSPEVRKEVESYGGEKAYEDAISALKLAIENNHKQQEEETKKAMADPKQFEEAKKDVERTKVVFLSATPFNTAMSLDYTESYIFSYPDKPKEGVYESPEERVTRQGTFVMDTFPSSHKRNNSGIVSRVGEAQISDPEKSGEEEIGFSDRLQHELNTMSGRQLDSEYDYSREFPLLSDPVSKRVNQAINDITSGKYSDLEKFFKNILSDYPNMTAVFEIIKTQQSIPRIKEHLAKGRKVAIYHRRMSSSKGITPPFATGIHGALLDPKTQNLADEFIEEYKDLFAWERTIPFDKFPNEIIMEAFATEEEKAKHKEEMEKWRKKKAEFDRSGKKKGMPKPPRLQAAAVAEFNGQVTDAKKELARNAFNDDSSPCKLIVCQISAAKEGIDLHDKTGKHQRVMMVLSLPESPIEFVQVEGRIYRVGSKSNAIFEYPLLGIDLEVASFAMKINGRSQTSDNLALGSESRGLRDSIARAVLASRDIPVTDNMGTGGKMLDDRQQQKKSGYEDAVKNFEQWQGEPFPESFDDMEVPDPLGYKMGEWAKSENGETVLVPGAKRGSIADYIPTKSRLVALEPMMEWFAKLQVKLGGGGRKILNSSFEDYSSVNKADAVVMNLAHGKGKNASLITKTQDWINIAKALYHLEEGGRVVAVVDGNFNYSAQKFDKEFALSAEIQLPDFLFNGNKSKIIIIDKVTDNELRKAMPEKQTVDLSGYQTYETFFRSLKTVDVPKRTIDDLARIGKRVGGAGKKFGENPLIKKEKKWQTDKMGPSVDLWRTGFSAYFRKSLIPYVNREGGVSWNYSVHLKFESIRTGDTAFIEGLARTYLFLSKMLKLNQQDFEEELQNQYKYPQSNEVMAYRDAFSVYRSVIEAALGKTPLQIKNLAEGKVENELSGEMTVDEFEDAFRSYNNGNAQMAALADKVFSIIKQIPGLKFRVVTDASNFGHNAIAHYAPAKNAIELNNKYINSTRYLTEEQKGQTLVHEMIHAATCYLMSEYEHNGGVNLTEKQKQACEDIFKVYDALKEDEAFRASLRLGTKISDNSEYGMENAYEMVAELANPVFRAKLKAKKLFKQLINNVMILFGMKLPGAKVEGETDALTIVEHAMYDLLDSFDVDQYNNYVGSDYAREAPVFARKVTDEKLINELEKTPKIRLFRSMQLIAGKLYPPMAAKVKGKLVKPSEIGEWEQADEHPELIKDKNGKRNFTLNKGNGSQIDAAYNPYLHLSRSPLNDQFTSASKRPNLVTVEVEVPESELYSRYKAEGAKDAVGEMTWHAGPVSGKLPKDKKRKVVLSRWAKPVRIVPDKEVAERIAEILKGEDIAIPSNTVTPSLRKELEKQGVKVRDTEKRYRFIGEKGARAIDKAREADNLILNLATAREMEKSDVDARSIKLATGWERGADGKWRYEQMDATFHAEGRNAGDVVKLGDITSDKALFEAYSELKGMEVEFFDGDESNLGAYDDETGKIYVNAKYPQPDEILVHEIQHYIQEREGFALGGSEMTETDITPEERTKAQEEIDRIKDDIARMKANPNSSSSDINLAELVLRSKEAYLKKGTKSIGFDNYRKLAGEVEARNVSSRRGMSLEERMKTLAEETEDVSREEQNILYDVSDEDRKALEVASSESGAVYADPALAEAFSTQNVNQAIYSMAGKYLKRLYADGMLGKVLTGPYATINTKKAKADYKKAKEILSEYRDELENMLGSCTEAAKEDVQAVIDKIDRSIDYYKQLSEGKDVWRTDERSRYRLLDVFKALSGFARRNSHLRMAEHAVSLAESLNTKIRIVSDVRELNEEDRNAKGWYDTETGEVTVVIPNHTDTDDIEETIFHEIVGHKGMKEILGEDGFRRMLNDIYLNANKEIGERIMHKIVNEGMDYLVATEEVIAEVAEQMARGDEPRGLARFIDAVRYAVRKAFEHMGFRGALQYTEGDILYMLWKERHAMEKGDVLSYAKHQQMQRGLNTDFEGKRYRKSGKPATPRTVRDVYDANVRGLGYRFREAYQDSMLSLKHLQDAIVNASGKKMEEWEDAYTAENQLSSRNTLEMETFTRDYYNPLIHLMKRSMDKFGLRHEDLNRYLFAKSGLERNREFAVRDALNAVKNEENVTPDLAKAIEDYQTYRFDNKIELDLGKITFREFCEKMDEEAKFLIGLTCLDKNGTTRTDMHGNPIDVDAYCDALLARDYSGISDIFDADAFKDDAVQFVEETEGKDQPLADALWRAIKACTRYSLRKSKDSGTISVQQYEHVKGMMDWYVPMRGFNDTTAQEVYDYIGQEGIFAPTLKTAKGRLSEADDPVAVMLNMANSAIMHGNKNLMKVNLLNLAQNHPTDLLTVDYSWVKNTGTDVDPVWEYVYPDIQPEDDAETIAQKMQDFKDEMNDLKEQGLAKQLKERLKLPYVVTPEIIPEHIVRVKRNGKEFTIILNGNPRAAQAVNGIMDRDKRKDYGLSFMSKVNRWMAANFTTRSVTFVARNLTRDVMFGNAAVFVKENRPYRRRFRLNELKVAASIAGLLDRHKRGRLNPNNPMDKAFQEFLEGGGETGFVQLLSVDDYKKMMKKDLKKQNAAKAAVVNGAKSLMNGIEFMNRCAEDYTRFTVFLTSREMGRSVKRSVSDAKEITVNFNKRGAGSGTGGFIGYSAETLKTFYIFANAAIQSLNNFGKMAKEHPGKMAAMVGTMYAMGLFTPIMNEVLVSALGGGDDDPYNNLPDYIRRNHICIYIGDGNFITIPLAIELRALYGLGESTYQMAKRNMSESDAALAFASGMCELLPINFAQEAGIFDAMTPTAVAPLVEAYVLNKNFTGRPIYKDNGFNKRDPEWTKAYSGTSKALVATFQELNEMTGGDNVKSGKIDINPARVEFLVSAYFGGFGQNFTDLSKMIQAACGVEDYQNTRNVPIAKAFVRQADERNAFAKSRENYERYRAWYEEKTHLIGGYKKEAKKADEYSMEYADKLKQEVEGKDQQKFMTLKIANRVLSRLYKNLPLLDTTDKQNQLQRVIDLIKVQAVEKCKAIDKGEIVEDDWDLDWLDNALPELPTRDED